MKEYFLVSEFSNDTNGGLSCVELDLENGSLKKTGFISIPFINSVAVSANGRVAGSLRYLNGSEGEGGAAVITPNLITRCSTHGIIPCYIDWDTQGCWMFATNYISGSILCRNTQNGTEQLIEHVGSGVHPRQDKAHPHHVIVTENGQWLLITDLGTNEVVRYRFTNDNGVDIDSALRIKLPDAFGPRHLFLVDDRTAYVVGELTPGIAVLDIEKGVCLNHLLFCNLPCDSTGAAIDVSRSQKLLAATIRTANQIALCKVHNQECSLIGMISSEGEKPMSICFSNGGNWLLCANESSNEITVFSVTENHLQKVSSLACKQPMCIKRLTPQSENTKWQS